MSMDRRVLRAVVFWTGTASCLLAAAPARAYGPLEHKAIALLAESRLTPRARAAVQDILGPDVGLDRIANCADGLLYAVGTYDCGGVFSLPADPEKVTQKWHFVDIPVVPGKTMTAAEAAGYCPNGEDCVFKQIDKQAAVLHDPEASLQQRRVALMYVVHLVGDEHQPLHCADDDDRGGNMKAVTVQGKSKNLHSLFDDMGLAEDWRQQSSVDPAPLARELADIAAQGDPARWTSGDFVMAAVLEDYREAQDVVDVYKSDPRGFADDNQASVQFVAKTHMAVAGVRLAALLERSLGQGAGGSRPAGPAETARRAGESGALKTLGMPVKFD